VSGGETQRFAKAAQPPWSFGFDTQTRGTRETGAPCDKVPGSSRVPAPPWVGSRSPDGWDQIPYQPGGWVLHQPPWSFGFDSQTRNQGKQAHPVLKYRVPHGSHWVGVWVWDWIDDDDHPHSSSHALSFFSPPSLHILSLSPAFTSVWLSV